MREVSDAKVAHGHARRSGRSPTYYSWQAMLARCYNPNHRYYDDYGGRGIRVCRGWYTSFAKFLRDMGPRPPGTSLDRIDVDGHYTPANCRWAPATVQRQNQRPPKR
jgi:hypothetical protein